MYEAFFKCDCGNEFSKKGEQLTEIVNKIIDEGCEKCQDPKNNIKLTSHEIIHTDKLINGEFTKQVKF
jgi:hypothetical protein